MLVQFAFKIWSKVINDKYLLSLMKLKMPNRYTRAAPMLHLPVVSCFNNNF